MPTTGWKTLAAHASGEEVVCALVRERDRRSGVSHELVVASRVGGGATRPRRQVPVRQMRLPSLSLARILPRSRGVLLRSQQPTSNRQRSGCVDRQKTVRAGYRRCAFRHDSRPSTRPLTGSPGRRDRPSKRLELCRDARHDDGGVCQGAWRVPEDRARRLCPANARPLHVLVRRSGSRKPGRLPPHPGPLDARTRIDFHRDSGRPHAQMSIALHRSALAALSRGGENEDSAHPELVEAGGSWQRAVTQAQAGANTPAGIWVLTIDETGWRIKDPMGTGNWIDAAYRPGGLVELRGGIWTRANDTQSGNGWCQDIHAGPTNVPFGYTWSVTATTLTITLAGHDGCGETNASRTSSWRASGRALDAEARPHSRGRARRPSGVSPGDPPRAHRGYPRRRIALM